MKSIKLPVSWEMCGFIEIEANSIEEAVEIFNKNIDSIPLPSGSDYVDGSFALTDHEPETIGVYNEGVLLCAAN